MASSIHRIPLPVADYQAPFMSGPPLSVAVPRDGSSAYFDLWFEHDDQQQQKATPIYVFGTGHRTPWTAETRSEYRHLGTIVTTAGLVWHIYTGPLLTEATA